MKKIEPDIMAPDFNPAELEEVIECAHCGKPIKMGKGIKERHRAKDGHYYLICRECHEKEWPVENV